MSTNLPFGLEDIRASAFGRLYTESFIVEKNAALWFRAGNDRKILALIGPVTGPCR